MLTDTEMWEQVSNVQTDTNGVQYITVKGKKSGKEFKIYVNGNVNILEPTTEEPSEPSTPGGVVTVPITQGKSLGKVKLNPTINKVSNYTNYLDEDKDTGGYLPDTVEASNLAGDTLKFEISPIDDNNYFILVVNFFESNDNTDYTFYGGYTYFFEPCEIEMEFPSGNKLVSVEQAGWYTMGENETIVQLTTMPEFDGYTVYEEQIKSELFTDILIQAD